jgi:hypothetical protein
MIRYTPRMISREGYVWKLLRPILRHYSHFLGGTGKTTRNFSQDASTEGKI